MHAEREHEHELAGSVHENPGTAEKVKAEVESHDPALRQDATRPIGRPPP